MAVNKWNIGIGGSWFTKGNWSAGVPDATSDVQITAAGAYTVALAGANAFAQSLLLNAAGVVLSETSTGTLSITGDLTLQAGTAVLNGSNTIGSVTQTDGLLKLGNSAGLGGGLYKIGSFDSPELLGTANVTVTNEVEIHLNATIAAAHGTTLDMNMSKFTLFGQTDTHVVFGEGANDGIVVWHTNAGSTVTTSGLPTTEVAKGTFRAGDAAWDTVFNAGSLTTIDAGATVDVNGFDGKLFNLQGGGSIANSGALATLTIKGNSTGNSTFAGAITGALSVATNGFVTLTGTNTYTGGTTVPNFSFLTLGDGGTGGTIAGDIVVTGTLVYYHSGTFTQTAGISGSGYVDYLGGATYTINRAETNTNGAVIESSTVMTNNAGAFGTGGLTLYDGAKLFVTANTVMGYSSLFLAGGATFAAAHGVTAANIAPGGSVSLDQTTASPADTVTIGAPGADGVVVWNAGVTTTTGGVIVDVAAGTLRAGDADFSQLTQGAKAMKIDAGATLDIASFSATVSSLQGNGTVTGPGGTALSLADADFAGTITGGLGVIVTGPAFLSGANTYTGGTTIDTSGVLVLGHGGTTGSVTGDITDNGLLYFDHSNAVTLTAAITGTGVLVQAGSNTLTINRAETYSGGTNVLAGTLAIGRADAIGNGALGLFGGEFIATDNVTLANRMNLSGDITIAASTGKTLSNATGDWSLDTTAPGSVTFGDATHAGTILWGPIGGAITNHNYTVTIANGVFEPVDPSGGFVIGNDAATVIAAAGTYNLGGFNQIVKNLSGSGKIVQDSPLNVQLTISNGNFAGQINGTLRPNIQGTVTLTGGGTYNGAINIENGGTLNLTDPAARTIVMNGNGTLHINNAAGVTDTFTLTLNGNDTVTAGAGTETFLLTNAIASNDTVNGGTGAAIDRITFQNPVTEAAGAMNGVSHIELIVLANGTNSIALSDANAATSDTPHLLTVTGGSGNDAINGSAVTAANRLSIASGTGNDTLIGGAGLDVFSFAPTALTSADTVNGGAGTALDLLKFTAAGSLGAAALAGVSHIEQILLANGTNNVALSDALVGSADDGHLLTITGGTDNDTISAAAVVTAVNMVVFKSGSGNDTLTGGAGTDQFFFTAVDLKPADLIGGGGGTDTIRFTTAGTIAATAFAEVTHVEQIALANGTNNVTLFNAMVTAADNHLVAVVGGTGADTINAGGVTTTTDRVFFVGGAGADVMTAGAGADTFSYAGASDSTSTGFDTINAINFAADRLDVPGAAGTITLVEGLRTGALSTAGFDASLASAFTALAAHHAGLFTATTGSLNGQTFLVVDLNGTAGYQAGADLVIHLASTTGTLVVGDFT